MGTYRVDAELLDAASEKAWREGTTVTAVIIAALEEFTGASRVMDEKSLCAIMEEIRSLGWDSLLQPRFPGP